MNKNIYYSHKKISIGERFAEDSRNQAIVLSEKVSDESLKKAIAIFLSSPEGPDLLIESDKFNHTLERISTEFYFIEAAGGLIQKDDTFLFIKRLGKWDLPKGKLDKGETKDKAAIRECEEECAVRELSIQKELPNSYHIYEYKKGFALKLTYWYYMTTTYSQELKPQTEENIEEVKWFGLNEIKNQVLENTYITIKELLEAYFNWK
jgi:8-oxo-dGTP pyrophosphatase MutT (NUDIX family)